MRPFLSEMLNASLYFEALSKKKLKTIKISSTLVKHAGTRRGRLVVSVLLFSASTPVDLHSVFSQRSQKRCSDVENGKRP